MTKARCEQLQQMLDARLRELERELSSGCGRVAVWRSILTPTVARWFPSAAADLGWADAVRAKGRSVESQS